MKSEDLLRTCILISFIEPETLELCPLDQLGSVASSNLNARSSQLQSVTSSLITESEYMMDEELGINRRPTSRFGQAPFSSLSEQEDIPLEEEKK